MKRSPPNPSGQLNLRSLIYGLAAAVVVLDQLSKAWARQALVAGPRQLLPGLLDLHLTRNTGAAFSLFTNSAAGLGLVSLLVVLVTIGWIQRQSPPLPHYRTLAVGFLLGGATGNGIDRWTSGAVVDFLALVPINFPVFNLADVAINLAVLCFAIDLAIDLSAGHGDRRP